jgi:hypothetical protein
MARLLVEAHTVEGAAADVILRLLIAVSVSSVDSGDPVTGLTAQNFRLSPASPGDLIALPRHLAIQAVTEGHWEPERVEPSGCYRLEIGFTSPPFMFHSGQRYAFGIQVRTFAGDAPPQVADRGQTIVELRSEGI